jgi:hypothetical protein
MKRQSARGKFVQLAIELAARKGKYGADPLRKQLSPRVAAILKNPYDVQKLTPSQIFYQRAATQPGSTSSDTWGADLSNYQTLQNAFLPSIRNYSAFDKMIAGGMRVLPMRVRVGAITTGGTGATAQQFHAKVVSKLTVSATTLTEQKVHCILVVTDELARQTPWRRICLRRSLPPALLWQLIPPFVRRCYPARPHTRVRERRPKQLDKICAPRL